MGKRVCYPAEVKIKAIEMERLAGIPVKEISPFPEEIHLLTEQPR